MVSKQQSSSWADFQPELLGLVLRRLPSHADRVRLRAVCRPWRSNAEMQFVAKMIAVQWLQFYYFFFFTFSHQQRVYDSKEK
ncbi:Os06g0148500 [Oryza sativa Japonica Group]|uniref:Os06g0148500 protein n=3 Tax=Oryza sativa TaxID=4530 RepID=B9FRH6_ORYSJ|nr:hypothetical protein OsI_21669 [Oryza sativa Indica Group]EEE65087.1 hypothetical protein OsJ_20128 [Oryza sativa Japonica Group]KAB8101219.1 hypothetical protein EE612_031935 [Oryza sativa]BAF18724.1 Os06g0148500 [Oryza sativa Japonica Group]BAS96163.1 Os06g0148500 [Oryza sativa Japonica Group]|eukprot:NP_001056810.1 Os06g0148500 [Oryza sativa Japonica Group]